MASQKPPPKPRQVRFSSWPIAILALTSLVMFLLLLGRRDITTSHEARVVQTARQMAAAGWPWRPDARILVRPVELKEVRGSLELVSDSSAPRIPVNPWLVPVINGQIRLHKPPLPYWCAAVMFRLFGFGEAAARVVPALLGAAAALLMFDVARRILGRRSALIAAAVWITTYFVIEEFRKAMADPYLAFFTLAALWAWLAAADRAPRNMLLVLAFYLAIALGALAKGPVILLTVIPACLLLRFLLKRRTWASWPVHVLGVTLALGLSLAWPVYVVGRVPHAIEFWRYESIGELSDNVQKARPWWAYLGVITYLPLPWVPMWIAGIAAVFLHGRRGLRSPRGRRRMFALIWFALSVLMFSLSNIKKPTYLLPLMPAQTLIIADAIVLWLAFARRNGMRGIQAVLAWAQYAIGVGFMCGLVALMWRADAFTSVDRIAACSATAAAILVAIPLLGRRPGRWLAWQFAAYAIVLLIHAAVFTPGWDNPRSGRGFAQAITAHSRQTQTAVLVSALPEEVSVYLPLDLPDWVDARAVLVPLDDRKNKANLSVQAWSARVHGRPIESIEPVEIEGNFDRARWKLFRVILAPQNRT